MSEIEAEAVEAIKSGMKRKDFIMIYGERLWLEYKGFRQSLKIEFPSEYPMDAMPCPHYEYRY